MQMVSGSVAVVFYQSKLGCQNVYSLKTSEPKLNDLAQNDKIKRHFFW